MTFRQDNIYLRNIKKEFLILMIRRVVAKKDMY